MRDVTTIYRTRLAIVARSRSVAAGVAWADPAGARDSHRERRTAR